MVGSSSGENELILNMVLDGLVDVNGVASEARSTRGRVLKISRQRCFVWMRSSTRAILETDANAVANRVQMRMCEGGRPSRT